MIQNKIFFLTTCLFLYFTIKIFREEKKKEFNNLNRNQQ